MSTPNHTTYLMTARSELSLETDKFGEVSMAMISAPYNSVELPRNAAALNAHQGGQWTRDDLPSRSEVISLWLTEESRGESADAVLGAVVAHLNAHHPKPDADSLLYRAERAERDAAVARAEAAERVLSERDEQGDDATRAAR